MNLEIPDYPYYETDAMRRDEALLGELERGYRMESDPDDALGFLFGFAPPRLLERVAADRPRGLELESCLWLLYVAGYFGGQWLRARIVEAQLDTMLPQVGAPPTPESFRFIAARVRNGASAARGGDAEALAYAESVLPELVHAFGYNQGLLQQILDDPPQGSVAPRGFLVPAGTLWCGYRHPHLELLADLHDVSEKLEHSHDAEWSRLGAWIREAQDAEVERGRTVWSTWSSVQGFSAQDYERMLDLAALGLEAIQAGALIAALAVAESTPEVARRAAAVHSCLASWRDAYRLGLMDDRFDAHGPRMPRFGVWR